MHRGCVDDAPFLGWVTEKRNDALPVMPNNPALTETYMHPGS